MQCPLATNQGQTSSKAQDLLWQEGRHPLADRAFPAWRYFARRPGSGGSVQSPPGWSIPAYKAWLFTALVQQLLGLPQPDPEALRGLSFASLVDAI